MTEDVSTGNEIPQPESFTFDAESNAAIEKILKRYPPGKQASGVIPLLYVVQRQMKRQTGSAWVPVKGMDAVAERLGMAPIRVYEVATFYFMFNTKPIGKFHLQACGTTPCWLRGSDDVYKACKDAAHVAGYGQTSADGLFTLTEVECLGACANAPMVQINDDNFEDLTAKSMGAILDALAAGKSPKPGPQVDRQTSCPEGGPTTLKKMAERNYDYRGQW